MRRWVTTVAALAATCAWLSASIEPSAWSVVDRDDVRVITNASAAMAASTLTAVLQMRSQLQQVASADVRSPLRVFAMKDADSLSAVAPPQFRRGDIHTFGFSNTGPHAAFVAVRMNVPEADAMRVLRHEYVHTVTASQFPDAPAWLDEGLSEFWGSMIVEHDRLIIGRPIARHVDQLRRRKWLPLAAVLKQRRGTVPSNQDDLSLFYAQSWAMVHYLLFASKAPGALAFMPDTHSLPAQFESELRHYVSADAMRETSMAWRPPATVMAQVETMPASRALAEQAFMVVSSERPRPALAMARRALSLDPDDALALEVMGTYYFLTNDHDQARDWLAHAFAKVPSYPSALYLSLLATTPGDAERYLAAAVKARPESDVAWQRLGSIFSSDGRLDAARQWCRQLWSGKAGWLALAHLPPCES